MAGTYLGRLKWSLNRDSDGHREYSVTHRVRTSSAGDGPAIVMSTAGLPAVGSTWTQGNDNDPWAFCLPTMTVTPRVTAEPNQIWSVEQKFTTKPQNRCQDTTIEDPLDEPDRISGSFTKYTREAGKDKDGEFIRSSSHEQIRGSSVERDDSRPNVKIEKNLATLPLSIFAPMIDRVNDASLWGLSSRCVKLTNVSWARQVYGTCSFYYTVSYEFDIQYDNFDRDIMDEGEKVLSKGGNPDDPRDFEVYKDRNGENSRVILNGAGEPWDGTGTDGPGNILVQLYHEANFLLLGLPASL